MGNVHVGNVLIVAMMERGGCVEGVRINFVRAMSRGARTIPAIPAAETATAKEDRGRESRGCRGRPCKRRDLRSWR